MDLGTFVHKVFRRTKRTASGDRFHVLDALEETQRTLRRERFWFNEGYAQVTLAGESTPRDPGDGTGYPADLLRIISAKNPNFKRPIRGVSPSFLREQQDTLKGGSRPEMMSYENKLIITHPSSTAVVNLLYVRDIGTVVQVYNDGERELRLIDYTQASRTSATTVDDSYTNDWFIEAMDLLIEQTLYHLWMGQYANTAAAQRAGMLAARAKETIRKYNTVFQETAPARAWL